MRYYSNSTRIFQSFAEAQRQRLFSRSIWKQQGRVVPDDATPIGVVVQKQGLVLKAHGPWTQPVVEDQGERLILAFRWFDVFSETQTTPKTATKSCAAGTIETKENKDSPPTVSLMTEETSQIVVPLSFASNSQKTKNTDVNSVRAYVPEDLVLPDNCSVKNEIYWFLGMIYWKHLETKLPWDKPTQLKSDYLKENVPNWSKVWKTCDALRLVERDWYSPGEKCYGYCTADPYRSQTHRLRYFDNKVLAKRIRQIEQKYTSRPVLQHLRKHLDRLTVDMNGFSERFANNPKRHYYLAHLRTILDKQIRFSTDEFAGRIHTNVSNLYKPLRALLRVDGTDDALGELDIPNSQPLFCGLAAKAAGLSDTKFLGLCENGELYNFCAHKLGLLRETFKKELLTAFYAKNGYQSQVKRFFVLAFPQVAKYIAEIKKTDYRRLARQMQRTERRFVVDSVCLCLMRRRPEMFVTTIHDSVLAKFSDGELVSSVFREKFEKLGVSPAFAWKKVAHGESC